MAWDASLRLRFEQRGETTVLCERAHCGPLRVQKALYPEAGAHKGICHTVILHPPAGIAGGDALRISAEVDAHSHVVLSTPGASKWYKSNGQLATMHTDLKVADNAVLEYLPQDTIFFDACQAEVHWQLQMHDSSRFIGWDCVQFSRSGQWRAGRAQLRSDIRVHDRLIWSERADWQALADDFSSMTGLAGHSVMGTLWAIAPRIDAALIEQLQLSLPFTEQLKAGMTCVQKGQQQLLLMRVLADEAEPAKNLMIKIWSALRSALLAVPAQPLRLWAT
ncbi:MAG: hypothetical protein RLZZ502_1363 [Pseudomonadota bacterium]|jgi:urease accessory protein